MKKIEILGMGWFRCDQLAERVKDAVKELGIDAEVIETQDIKTISDYGVLVTPALVVDGVVKVSGNLLKVKEIKDLIK